MRDYAKIQNKMDICKNNFICKKKDILNFIQTMLNVASDFAITKIEKAKEKEKIVRIYFNPTW